ncbi:MAG: carbohydrate binding family 9 domain-containing protein [Candidatus Marinimicrobia bacterium]|nr:carbohydrate binding family 9 domain-containing protein [Candidatus Neomarinimicrobiota bacterium]
MRFIIKAITLILLSQILLAEKMETLKDPTVEAERFYESITIDGNLEEESWGRATGTDYFIEIDPGENIMPSEKTKVKVGYDESNLYVAFWASANPADIRASYQKRDRAWGDDFVAIFLDTYGDANVGTMIGANPYGVQLDAKNDGNNDDESFDLIYESQGRITDSGYQVEMSIPFSSLSFPEQEVQEWKVGFYRSLPREKRAQIVWGGFDRTDPCFLCQLGTLTGIRDIKQRGSLEFLPAIVGSQASALDANNTLQKGDINGEASLGIKYSFSSDRFAELTINPDFSQVEADEQQVDVNTTFALYFQEKRPFFNAGNDLIDTWINPIYTRSINNPKIAGRIINRGQKQSWYMLSALDENSPYTIPGEEQSFSLMGGPSFSNIFRMKRTLTEGSFLGVLATDRRMANNNGSGSTVGFDTRYRLNKKYQIEFQTVFSKTVEPKDSLLVDGSFFGDDYSFTFDGESFTGNAVELELRRDTEHWNLEMGYDHSTPTFRAENGFVSSNNEQRLYMESVWVYSPNTFLNKFVGGFYTGINQNLDGEIKRQSTFIFSNFKLPKQTNINSNFNYTYFRRFKETNFKNLWKIGTNINSKITKSTSIYFGGNYGIQLATFLDVPETGYSFSFYSGVDQ